MSLMKASMPGSCKNLIVEPVSNCDPRQVRRLEEWVYRERAREREREKELAKSMQELHHLVLEDRRAERKAAMKAWASEPTLRTVQDDDVAVQTRNSLQEERSKASLIAEAKEHFSALCSKPDPFALLRKHRLIKMKSLSYRLRKAFDIIFGRDYPEPLKDDWSIWLGHGWKDRVPSWEIEDDSTTESKSSDCGGSNDKSVDETEKNDQQEGVDSP